MDYITDEYHTYRCFSTRNQESSAKKRITAVGYAQLTKYNKVTRIILYIFFDVKKINLHFSPVSPVKHWWDVAVSG